MTGLVPVVLTRLPPWSRLLFGAWFKLRANQKTADPEGDYLSAQIQAASLHEVPHPTYEMPYDIGVRLGSSQVVPSCITLHYGMVYNSTSTMVWTGPFTCRAMARSKAVKLGRVKWCSDVMDSSLKRNLSGLTQQSA